MTARRPPHVLAGSLVSRGRSVPVVVLCDDAGTILTSTAAAAAVVVATALAVAGTGGILLLQVTLLNLPLRWPLFFAALWQWRFLCLQHDATMQLPSLFYPAPTIRP